MNDLEIQNRINKLKQEVYQANIALFHSGLIILTWGNISQIDRELKLIAIKPSGVPYETMKENDIVLTNLEGVPLPNQLNPSSDLPTHLEIYKHCSLINSICHTHSTYATMFAQAGKEIEVLGTTHSDYFNGNIPVTSRLTNDEIIKDYEENIGLSIVNKIDQNNQLDIPAILVYSHGVFTWGKDSQSSLENAIVIEQVAHLNYGTHLLTNNNKLTFQKALLNKHYNRKHGKNAYYGQKH
jgi:L-ribulose-5-phosphate 4-epimerase